MPGNSAPNLRSLRAHVEAREAKRASAAARSERRAGRVEGAHSLIATQETRVPYAIMFEGVDARTGLPRGGQEITHAVDAPEALRVFWTVHKLGTVRVVGVAPVVGGHVKDAHGERLVL